jgi:Zn-dependent peptidase ImmA (M78 family)
MNRQAHYESALALAVNAVSDDDADFWLKEVSLPGPKPRGKLVAKARDAEIEKRLAFFGVSTIGSWRTRYGNNQKAARFRSSGAHLKHEGATSIWLRQGELEASIASTQRWCPEALRARLPEIRALSKISKPERFLQPLKRLFAEAGVAFVVLRAPKGCRASGASRLVADDKAMVLVSFRHRADDQFWFTVFHEIGHLLLHDASPFVDEDETGEMDPCEREANEFAAEMIVPADRVPELESLRPDEDTIRRFAVSLGVAPGLILGQLEHRKIIAYGRVRNLRRTWTWLQIEGAASL